MAAEKIACRVCGKMFEPCSYCKSHADTFRWRNFACSIDCARKYVAEATAYREAKNKPQPEPVKTPVIENTDKPFSKKKDYIKKEIETAVTPVVVVPTFDKVNGGTVDLPIEE